MSALAAPSGEPPSYDIASSSNPHAQLRSTDLLSLILDGQFIYSIPASSGRPSLLPPIPLYEISKADAAFHNGDDETYKFRKPRYRLTSTDGEGEIRERARSDPIYFFRTTRMIWPMEAATILLANDAGQLGGYKTTVVLSKQFPKQWMIPECFVVKQQFMKWLSHSGELHWMDMRDTAVVVESKLDVEASPSGPLRRLPRLDLKVGLDDRKRDFLVVCWIERIWKSLKLHSKDVPS
ncbi:hypothetical protein SUNI508_06117 [Seiridium unicorne]|uniref:Uncharacterized protein n=1 Tax=Seiridium unicorne TaxID=138068 RepID=A0ABR2V295_9PEZI